MLNVRSLWVMTSVLNAFSFSPGSYPYADKAFFTTPYPPLLRYEKDRREQVKYECEIFDSMYKY